MTDPQHVEQVSPITGEVPAPFDRARVEALMNENQAKLDGFAKRGVVVSEAQIVMTRLRAMCDVLFGDMDSQPRLAFEARLAAEYRAIITATETEINKAVIAQGITPTGFYLPGPNGGPPR
jgi:hypothetical protein